jgi:DNA transformation protein
MTVSNRFLLYAVESMCSVAPISYRRIFNGYGVYHQQVQFAIVINDRLYFRADDYSRGLYLAKCMTAFLPPAIGHSTSNFFEVPDEVLTNSAELIHWMRIAVEAAQGGYTPEESLAEMPVRHANRH